MNFGKHMRGDWSGGLVKLIGIVVLIMLAPALLRQCAQSASHAAGELTNTVTDAASNAVNAGLESAANAGKNAIDSTVNGAKDAACSVVGGCSNALPNVNSQSGNAWPSNPNATTSQCPTQDEAARAALAQARDCTQVYGVEFAGNISYRIVNGQRCFGPDGPYLGKERSGTSPPELRAGWTSVAHYHSHPGEASSGRFSAGDLCNYVANEESGYVVATQTGMWPYKDDGEVRRFDHRAGAKFGAGDSDVRDCLSTQNCPWLELWLDLSPRGVGTITRLDDLQHTTPNCPQSIIRKPPTGGSASGQAPSCFSS